MAGVGAPGNDGSGTEAPGDLADLGTGGHMNFGMSGTGCVNMASFIG